MAKNWSKYLNVSDASTNLIFGNLGFVLFLGFLAIVYIANAHYAERKVREIQITQKEIRDLRWEYVSMKADLMRRSTQTQMQEQVEEFGLRSTGAGVKVIDAK